jgi:hypothetical protein
MIPHMAYEPPFGTAKSPAIATPCVGGRSTELSSNEVGDGTTEASRLLEILGLGEDAHDGLGSGWSDEHAPFAQFLVASLDPPDAAAEQSRGTGTFS